MKKRFPAAGREAYFSVFTGIPLDKRRRSAIMSVPIVLVQLRKNVEKSGNIFRCRNVYIYMDEMKK